MRVGFVGTGSIGAPVALNLLEAGHDLLVHDRSRTATRSLRQGGARVCESPAALAADAEVIFLSLPSDPEVESVCFGPRGLFTTIQPGTHLIDLSTVSVTLVPRLIDAQRIYSMRYLAAPVSQGVDAARAGRLTIFVGGDSSDVQICRPLLESIGSVVIHTGDHSSAVVAKLVTNLLWYVHAVAIGEALVLGAKSGVELTVLREVVLASCGSSWVAEHDIPAIFDGSFDPTFTTGLCCKDLRLIGELAALLHVPIELGALVEQIFRRTQNLHGPGSPELSVVQSLQISTNTGLQLREAM